MSTVIDGWAVVLGDGRVLVMAWPYTTARLWDPTTGAWESTEAFNKPRTGFAAVPLVDGRLLVTGGLNDADQSYSSTYIYDHLTGHWSKVGLLGTARTIPSAALLHDGRVLVAGGYYAVKPDYGLVPQAVLVGFDPRWSAGNESSQPRLADMDPPERGAAMATAELFDPVTGTWSATGSMIYARAGAGAVTLSDGRVLVVGSASWESGINTDARAPETAEIYDPATGRFGLVEPLPGIDWSALEKLGIRGDSEYRPSYSGGGALVPLNDGGAVLIGHVDEWKHAGWVTRSLRFDPAGAAWSEIGDTYAAFSDFQTDQMITTAGVRDLSRAMVAQMPDGRILVAGGTGTGTEPWSPTAIAELYDPTADTWSELPPMPEPRADGNAVVLVDGTVVIVGGRGSSGDDLASAIRFIPSR